MKKLILVLIFSVLFISNTYSQSGWVSSFFNNTCYFSKIVKRDSLNIFAFGNLSKYYYKSTDAGNTWISNPNISLDSVCGIYDGQFINSQTGWIVGATRGAYFGIILKTTNGGTNWSQKLVSFNDYIFRSVFFLNSNTGWAGTRGTGGVGRLYKTTNGGDNWNYQDFNNSSDIYSIKFFDINSGWIVAFNGLLAKTTDGGLNWINKPINNLPPNYSNSYYYFIVPINFTNIWALIHSHNSISYLNYSQILNTTNGGDNWNLKYNYTDSLNTNSNYFWNINFNNFSTGFAVGGYNFISRTSDAGSNWNKIFYSTSLGYNYSTSSLLYLNSNDIIATGGSSYSSNYPPYNFILKSTNSGLNWSVKSYNNEYRFTQIEFIDANTGFVLADTGRIFRTTNSGMNWNLNYRPIASWYWLNKISFANSSTGCAIGNSSPTYYDNGRIYRTTNKGDNWTEVFYSPVKSVFSLKFIDQQNGFAGYDSSRLLKTTNSGLNWIIVNLSGPIPFDIKDIFFINNSSGWALGHYYHHWYPFPEYERNVIWKTTDSGNNWNIIFDSTGITENYYIQFIDNNKGYKLSNKSNYLQKTINGGINWFNINVPNITTPSSIKFINENTGWIGGVNSSSFRVIVKTTNGGNNWFLQFSDYYKKPLSIFAFNSDIAWFCGEYSSIYKTTDGGGNLGIREIGNNILPSSFSLSQNYPNPFNPTTNIRFQIKENAIVTLKIYDILGKEITTLVNEKQSPGTYEVTWDARHGGSSTFPSGVYFYQLSIGNVQFAIKKMILLK